jgi:glycosyltransferase involved in cell wall biosynthesis
MNVLFSITDLRVGGAQTFLIRLANHLSLTHSVHIFVLHPHKSLLDDLKNYGLRDQIHVFTPELPSPLLYILRKMDRVLKWSALNRVVAGKLQRYIREHDIDIVNTHLYHSDYCMTANVGGLPIVLSDHGDYNYILKHHLSNKTIVAATLRRVDRIVCLSDKNSNTITALIKDLHAGTTDRISKIYLGTKSQQRPTDARAKLGIDGGAFVYGLVARGIPEKGWKEALLAFTRISQARKDADLHLVFVGQSKFLDGLKKDVPASLAKRVHFVGHSFDPSYWINAFDVGLLPSYFAGETLPNTIIEYLSCKVPAIATNVGGIPDMVCVGSDRAGLLIDLTTEGRISLDRLTAAMETYLDDERLRKEHGATAEVAFRKYSIEECSAKYERLFRDVLGRVATAPQPQVLERPTTSF